jgi:hypothetical protein
MTTGGILGTALSFGDIRFPFREFRSISYQIHFINAGTERLEDQANTPEE